MVDQVANLTLFLLAVATVGALYRVITGPSLPDRIIAADAIAINLIGIIAVVSIKLNTLTFVDVILVIAILGFMGTVALSKFLVKGVIIDRDNH
ncbi:MAG: Na(+)/H(+) antiporter subunit F1 [Clostridia bacterium]|nr:Na(+)/H(+) antiporter subunit F1 [Clostridia bacterium]